MVRDTRGVLVIEDSAQDAGLIRIAFEKAGFDNPVRVLHDPQEALRYLAAEGEYSDRGACPMPGLVMLDHKMPGDGWPVIEYVRSRADLEWLPVVVFSGSDDPIHQEKARSLGANAYHVKPQDFGEFIGTIKRIGDFWLRSRPPQHGASL